MLSQEDFERVELLGDTLDVIQTVDTDDNLASLESLLQRLESVLHSVLTETLDELHGLDTDWVSTNLSVSAFEFDTVWHSRQPENSGAGGEEVSSIVVGVETRMSSILPR